MRQLTRATAIILAVAAVSTGFRLPPARLTLASGAGDGTVAGVLHVHTTRSDGRLGPDDIAAAAARAGLAFVVFTDHGDATRVPDPPAYRHGVLCLDGVEISTTAGHYLALGLPAAPYPLGGEARTVVEDVARLGGVGIVAHPDSPKPDLRWGDWTAPVDAVELLNLDTAWRAHAARPGWRPTLRLLQAVGTYPIRAPETIAALLGEVSPAYSDWERLTAQRRVVAVAGADAHGTLLPADVEPASARALLPLPGYETTFRVMSLRVAPARPLAGEAAADAATIVEALRAGRVYIAVDAIASPPVFEFTAANRRGQVGAGAEIAADGPVTLRVRSNAPPTFTTTIWQGQAVVGTGREGEIVATVGEAPAVYRAEIRATDRPGAPPWIISNPIYVRGETPPVEPVPLPETRERVPLVDGSGAHEWRAEADPTSVAAVETIGDGVAPEVILRYTLGGGPAGGQFAAAAVPTPGGIASSDRLTFTAVAEQPLRVSVQVRAAVTGDRDERWQRSVYVGQAAAVHTVFFDDLAPVGATRTLRPPLDQVHSLVLVIETTNTRPGSTGRLRVTAPALDR